MAHNQPHSTKRRTGRGDQPLQRSRLVTALMTSVLPEMMTPQVSSRMAHWDAPRTRPTCSALRPVRRSLFAELDTAPRESPYHQHNGGLSTSATEGLTWCAPQAAPAPAPIATYHFPATNAIRLRFRCLPQAKDGLPPAAVSGSLRRRRRTSKVNDTCFS